MKINTFNEFQQAAAKTAIYPKKAKVVYPALGLPGEVGEVAEKVTLLMAVRAGKVANQVKKVIRDDENMITQERLKQISGEIGGVLWYCAALATDLGLNLADIADENIEILASRQERGTLKGDGDKR